jgi:prepilin-type N-terminal cleavage/methylation domain-containing protein
VLTRTRKAFTLLELIVVIVILGVLALIAIPTFQSVITKSKESAAKRSAESIGRNAVALAAFDQVTDVNTATVDGSDDPAMTYLTKAASETNGQASVISNSVVEVNGYDVTLTFVGAKVTASAIAPAVG